MEGNTGAPMAENLETLLARNSGDALLKCVHISYRSDFAFDPKFQLSILHTLKTIKTPNLYYKTESVVCLSVNLKLGDDRIYSCTSYRYEHIIYW